MRYLALAERVTIYFGSPIFGEQVSDRRRGRNPSALFRYPKDHQYNSAEAIPSPPDVSLTPPDTKTTPLGNNAAA